MPAKDMYHDLVHRLLVADGWRITHDPYRIVVGRKNLFVDLGAEKIIAADRDGKRIAVEVKSFEGKSEVHDLEEALGQYLLYLPFLRLKSLIGFCIWRSLAKLGATCLKSPLAKACWPSTTSGYLSLTPPRS